MRAILTAGLAALVTLSACGSRDTVLPGERLDLRAALDGGAPYEEAPLGAQPIALPAPQLNASWSHVAGSTTHYAGHPALSATPQPLWSVDLGEGNEKRARITADPVVAGGRIFAMDARGRVTAVTPAGEVLWRTDLVPTGERARDASGGGLAVADNTLYATTGFGALYALDVATGARRWEQELDATAAGAPTVDGDLVYLVARDSRAWAVNRDTGRIAWTLPGTPTDSNIVGGPAPAVTDRAVLFPFGSGELVAALKRGGVQLWSAAISGERKGRAYTTVTDITADPVVVGNTVYTGTPAGRLVAIDLTNGERRWTATDGAMGPVAVAGGSIFAVTDIAELIRLDAETGRVYWRQEMPYYEARRLKRRKAIVAHYGPVLAGGKLWVGSGDDVIRAFSPETGQLLQTLPLRGGAASPPVVAGGTLYIVSGRGQLHAFR